MNKREALEYTIKMWSWLAKDGNRTKPEYRQKVTTEDSEYYSCALCDIYEDGSCNNCALDNVNNNCNNDESSYDEWSHSLGDLTTREMSAQRIVNICKQALEALDNEIS